ncbi:RNA 2',3'-cyclic phosphodiesterase [Candidatus Woesearchaeota archaeon]|nr:RNA 2',3'-cyclic phosphodiesterase [Candidatus Woesearchaeota archaeon]
MRLFIGFDASQEAEHELLNAQKKIENAKINLVKDFHLTLKFLGEVDDDKSGEIEERLRKISFGSFKAELGGIGVFPSENHVKVIWIGLEPKDKIIGLQRKIEEALQGMFPKDMRFHPHITLARVKTVEDKEAFKENLKNIRIERIRFKVDKFKLIKSALTPDGPVYEVLEEYNSN